MAAEAWIDEAPESWGAPSAHFGETIERLIDLAAYADREGYPKYRIRLVIAERGISVGVLPPGRYSSICEKIIPWDVFTDMPTDSAKEYVRAALKQAELDSQLNDLAARRGLISDRINAQQMREMYFNQWPWPEGASSGSTTAAAGQSANISTSGLLQSYASAKAAPPPKRDDAYESLMYAAQMLNRKKQDFT